MSDFIKTQTFQVTQNEAGQRLDVLLSRRIERVNRTEWQNRIRRGQVLVEGAAVKAARRMKSGETVEFSFVSKAEPEVDRNYSILYEDDSLMIIDKPPNLPVHPAGIYCANTLQGLLKEDRGDDFIAHFIHRLDRETSGLLLLGKNRSASAFLNRAFRKGEVRKEYLVIVEGRFPERLSGEGRLTNDADSPVRKKRRFVSAVGVPTSRGTVAGTPAGRASAGVPTGRGAGTPTGEVGQTCRTDFVRIGHNDEISLVQARLFTGRLHQIRATLGSLGFPVVGDRLYGIDERLYLKFIADEETDEDRKRLRLGRSALHCRRLTIPHPERGRMTFVSPLPKDMADLIRSARNSPTGQTFARHRTARTGRNA